MLPRISTKQLLGVIIITVLLASLSLFIYFGRMQQDIRQRAAPLTSPVAKIRSDGQILINGNPVFPFGFYQDADDAAHQGNFLLNDLNIIADAGFNLMHPTVTELSNTTGYRQAAPNLGVWTIAQFYQPSLVNTITALKNDLSIFAWDIGDDFNMPLNDPNKTPAIYLTKANQVRAIVPNHLTYGAGTGFPGFPLATYKNAFDIIGIEAYPIGNKDGSYQTETEESIEYYLYARQQLPDRAVFALPQTFAWPSQRLPTTSELRNMTYGALIARMNGILYYTFYGSGVYVPDTPLWDEAKLLRSDIEPLIDAILHGTYTGYDESPTDRNGSIHAGFWQYQNKTYVIIVNTAKSDRAASIPIPAGITGTLQHLFPNDTRYGKSLAITNDTITGTIPSYDTQVYEIGNATPTVSPTTGRRLKVITKLDAIGTGGNPSPINPTRNVSLELFTSPTSSAVGTATGTMTYNPATENFEGVIPLSTPLSDGSYLVRIKTPRYIKVLLPGFITFDDSNAASEIPLPQSTLQVGDPNDDGSVDILDYNIIADCYSDLTPARACPDITKKTAADLDDNGNVNGIDINLLIRAARARTGA